MVVLRGDRMFWMALEKIRAIAQLFDGFTTSRFPKGHAFWVLWGTALLAFPRVIVSRALGSGAIDVGTISSLQFPAAVPLVAFSILAIGFRDAKGFKARNGKMGCGSFSPWLIVFGLATTVVSCIGEGRWALILSACEVPYSLQLVMDCVSNICSILAILVWAVWGLSLAEPNGPEDVDDYGRIFLAFLVAGSLLPAVLPRLPVSQFREAMFIGGLLVVVGILHVLLRKLVGCNSLTFRIAVLCFLLSLSVERLGDSCESLFVMAGCTYTAQLAAINYLFGLLAMVVFLTWGKRRASSSYEKGDEDSAGARNIAVDGLSKRESEVVQLLLQGYTLAAIAQTLQISAGTAGTYKRRAYSKLGIDPKEGVSKLREAAHSLSGLHDASPGPAIRLVWPIVLGCSAIATCAVPGGSFSKGGYGLMLAGAGLCAAILAAVFEDGVKEQAVMSDGTRRLIVPLLLLDLALVIGALCDWMMGFYSERPITILICQALPACFAICLQRHFGSGCSAGDWMREALPNDVEVALAVSVGAILWRPVEEMAVELGLGSLLDKTMWVYPLAILPLIAYELKIRAMHADSNAMHDDDRALSYLRGRGLSEMEAQVAFYSAAGFSRIQICEKVHVARGTVNAYRTSAYRRLNIHSSKDLRELLNKDAGQSLS